jgi:hypothetical protein
VKKVIAIQKIIAIQKPLQFKKPLQLNHVIKDLIKFESAYI